ncbi:hypothetical protein PVAP13_1NG266195 [Panicum virgatum]|uniref:Uncharacterized protein n=1 Tax=Panicum virgatum TaxID=38727 RepID=A0A8T0WYB1_PANVG|nr:hypothetical protein PVAP13_1NG266195 [Panicum virgatum]
MDLHLPWRLRISNPHPQAAELGCCVCRASRTHGRGQERRRGGRRDAAVAGAGRPRAVGLHAARWGVGALPAGVPCHGRGRRGDGCAVEEAAAARIQAAVAGGGGGGGGQHHAPPHAGPHRLAVPPADSAPCRARMVDADQVAAIVSSTRAGGQRGEGARRPSALGLLRFRKEDADACRACAQPNLICLSFLF